MQERLINSRNKFTSVQVDGRKLYDEGKTFLDKADMLMAIVHAAREHARESDHKIHQLIGQARHLIDSIETHLGLVRPKNLGIKKY